MKRWLLALLATVLSCVPILLERATSPDLLLDSDTAVLLRAIKARNAPLSWFAGDWPLANHFYRPVATLTFEVDRRLYGNNAAGFGWTNDLLCVACVLLLFWFVRELTNRPWVSAACAIVFAGWHAVWCTQVASWLTITSGDLSVPRISAVLLLLVLVAAVVRHKRDVRSYVPAWLALLYLGQELAGQASLDGRMIAWLPGRTASVMSVFALISLASYARYERLSAHRDPPPEPTPLSPPATRNTPAPQGASDSGRRAILWAVVSVVALLVALASYEQAVMIPAALFGVACAFRLRGYRPRWGWQAAFWGALVGYLMLRHAIVPSAPSHYQMQQFRNGPGVRLSLLSYFFPPAAGYAGFFSLLDQGPLILLNPSFYSDVLGLASAIAAIRVVRKRWILALVGWSLSFLMYLPMAWLKQFDHYHYLPMALRSLFVVALGWSTLEAVLTALRPPVRQAPPRLVPAPGSLPHP